jgi:hypothetical protein
VSALLNSRAALMSERTQLGLSERHVSLERHERPRPIAKAWALSSASRLQADLILSGRKAVRAVAKSWGKWTCRPGPSYGTKWLRNAPRPHLLSLNAPRL